MWWYCVCFLVVFGFGVVSVIGGRVGVVIGCWWWWDFGGFGDLVLFGGIGIVIGGVGVCGGGGCWG